MADAKSKFHRPRRSACADASFQAEMKRVRAMSLEERMKASLSMKHRLAAIIAAVPSNK